MKLGSGSHTYEWTEFGKLPAGKQLGYTHGVVTDAKNNVYVHNQSEDAVCVFDSTGKFIKSWGKRFKDGAHGMFLSKEGGKEFLYLADYAQQKIVKTTLDGEVIFTIGQPDRPDIYDTP